MPLDVTVGGPASDSYISLAESDAFAGNSLGAQATRWLAASSAEKEKALRMAAVDIDGFVRSGAIWDADQRLRFPRAIDVDAAAVPFIPWRVKQAAYEQASYLLANIGLIEEAAKRRARAMFTFDEDEGPSGSIALDPSMGLLAPQAEALLTGFVATATGRAGRIGSVRVRSRYATAPYVTIE